MPRPKGSKNKPKVAVDAAAAPNAEAPKKRRATIDEYIDDDDDDRLKVPAHIIPDGMVYQWVTNSIFGQPQPQRRARFERKGWEPVPAERHDGMYMPKGYKGEIEIDGLVLMERPKEFSDRAHQNNYRKAREQVMAKEQQLRGGDIGVTLDSQHPNALRQNKISKSYERIQVPEE